MNVVKALNAKLPDLRDGGKWQASHRIDEAPTGVRPQVQKFDCGIQGSEAWFRFWFTEDGGNVDLRGTYSFNNVDERITINGADVTADDVILSTRMVSAKIRGVVEFEFQRDGKTHRYRFDATICKVF